MSFEYEKLNVYGEAFMGYIKEGKIYNNQGQLIGRSEEEYQKAISTATGFQDILYERGILQRPKTPEQINQELQDTLKQTQAMMLEMSTAMLGIKEKVTALEEKGNVKQTSDNESGKSSDVSGKNSGSQQGFRNNK